MASWKRRKHFVIPEATLAGLRVDPGAFRADVAAGAVRGHLRAHGVELGALFPDLPTDARTLGGWWDARRGAFVVTAESDVFEAVPPGAPLPEEVAPTPPG